MDYDGDATITRLTLKIPFGSFGFLLQIMEAFELFRVMLRKMRWKVV